MRGIDAQKANIQAAKGITRILKSSLGPKGMDKMLQGPDGDVCISALKPCSKAILESLVHSESSSPPSNGRAFAVARTLRQNNLVHSSRLWPSAYCSPGRVSEYCSEVQQMTVQRSWSRWRWSIK